MRQAGITDALIVEEHKKEVEIVAQQEELEIGLESLVEKHGMRKIMDALARMSSSSKVSK